MEKNSTQNIALDRIDTSVAVENFVILLKENKTFFLNGAWGSGKTDFLVNVSEKSKKKIVTIDFWKINDNRTSIEIVFSRLRPIIYFIIRAIAVFAVVVSILMSNVIDLGLSHYISDSFFKIFVTIIVLCVAAHQFFKPKSDIFYANILANFSFSKKVLVIDDFDRLSSSRQEEIYKLFSLLNGQLPIVFVGDINKINKVKDNYLSKIIDRRIELPFSLHPNEIWNDYFLKLEATFGVTLSDHFKRLLKSEGRNLRDRVHFNDYVNQEFFLQGKSGHVQVEQQLLVIYAYLFHPKLYKGLLDDELIEYTLSDEQKSELKYNGNQQYPIMN
ncbi:P-loop NTPase fold protein [Streptococcus henryi]|uniref:P-loop NTPase fold protein n=1 Tax=Streptococcus henryi TaxID=439219 RepID=UPI00039B800F|nr:P-loop NTPase fold protein [Streptococcus henryi]